MKKLLLISISALFLSACADKQQYEQAVLEQMKKEKDIQDYKIDPQHMADCVVDLTTKNMPGIFPGDPNRMTAYRNYTKMLTLMDSKDPKKTLEELRNDFGSPQALADAHNNYTESMMNCISAVIMESEEDEQTATEQAPPAEPAAPAQPETPAQPVEPAQPAEPPKN
jgi:PBP1b-binding outer membrane lipoprotein LpoB